MNHLDRIECAYRTFKRGGTFLQDVFKKEDKMLTGDECIKLKDTYGIRIEDVIKMAISHGFEIDKRDLAEKMLQDEIYWKSVKPLVKVNLE